MNELAKELIALNEITMALPDKEVVMMTSDQLQKILDIFDKSITLAIQVREQLAKLRYGD
jgi:DNA-directed RNA polymerase subunit F